MSDENAMQDYPMPTDKDESLRWVIRKVSPSVIQTVKTLAVINQRTVAQQLEIIVEEWLSSSGITLPAPDSQKEDQG